MNNDDTATRGQRAEELASRTLARKGLELLHRNYRCRWGEIDLIMQDRNVVVFVEVRYRDHRGFASGAESVDTTKQRKLVASAEHYLQHHPARSHQLCRFDVVSVSKRGVDWIQRAFDA